MASNTWTASAGAATNFGQSGGYGVFDGTDLGALAPIVRMRVDNTIIDVNINQQAEAFTRTRNSKSLEIETTLLELTTENLRLFFGDDGDGTGTDVVVNVNRGETLAYGAFYYYFLHTQSDLNGKVLYMPNAQIVANGDFELDSQAEEVQGLPVRIIANQDTSSTPDLYEIITNTDVDAVAPTVASTSPANYTSGVSTMQPIVITFSEAMSKRKVKDFTSYSFFSCTSLANTTGIDFGTFAISLGTGFRTLTATPTVTLTNATKYLLNINPIPDEAGNLLATGKTVLFQTET